VARRELGTFSVLPGGVLLKKGVDGDDRAEIEVGQKRKEKEAKLVLSVYFMLGYRERKNTRALVALE